MEKVNFKHFWYRLVAGDLLRLANDINDSYQELIYAYVKLNQELQKTRSEVNEKEKTIRDLQEAMNTENRDGAIAVQVIKERMRDMPPSVIPNHHRALKQRNMELIRENERLQRLLKEVTNNGHTRR